MHIGKTQKGKSIREGETRARRHPHPGVTVAQPGLPRRGYRLPIPAKQAALSTKLGFLLMKNWTRMSRGAHHPPHHLTKLEYGAGLPLLGNELVSSWEVEGQVSTLGVYTVHSTQQTCLVHTEEIQERCTESY